MTYLGTKPVQQKQPQFVSKEWRQSAKGQDCQLRLDGCQNDTETVVLCHFRIFSWAGLGQKPHDFLAAFGCGHCHRLLDLNPGSYSVEDMLLALGRTLEIHYREGRIG